MLHQILYVVVQIDRSTVGYLAIFISRSGLTLQSSYQRPRKQPPCSKFVYIYVHLRPRFAWPMQGLGGSNESNAFALAVGTK